MVLIVVFACLQALGPLVLLRRATSYLLGRFAGGVLGALITGVFGIFFAWHIGLSAQGVSVFSPLWGLIPLVVAECDVYFYTLYNLKKDCVARQGNLYTLPNGLKVRLSLTGALIIVLAALAEATLLSQLFTRIGASLASGGLISALRYRGISWILDLAGLYVLLDLASWASRVRRLANRPSLPYPDNPYVPEHWKR